MKTLKKAVVAVIALVSISMALARCTIGVEGPMVGLDFTPTLSDGL